MHRLALSAISALSCLLLTAAPILLNAQTPPPIPAGHVRIHYFRPDGNYLGWAVYAFGDTTEDTSNFNGGPVQVTGRDSFGAYFDVGVTATAQNVGIIIHNGNTKDPGPNEFIEPATQGNEYWQLSGSNVLQTTQPPTIQQTDPAIPANKARIHYFRPDSNYASWTVYAFGDTTEDTSNFNGGQGPRAGHAPQRRANQRGLGALRQRHRLSHPAADRIHHGSSNPREYRAHPLFPSGLKLCFLDGLCFWRHHGRHVQFQRRPGLCNRLRPVRRVLRRWLKTESK